MLVISVSGAGRRSQRADLACPGGFGVQSLWLGSGWLDLGAVQLLLALQLTLAAKEVVVLRKAQSWKPWFKTAAAVWRRRGEAGHRPPAGEAGGEIDRRRRPAGDERDGDEPDDVHAGAVTSALGWVVVTLLVGADGVIGLPNATLVLLPGIRIQAHVESVAVCTAAVTALAFVAAAYTLALFCHRDEIAL